MKNKPKLLFWNNGFLLHFSLAYYLQSKLDAHFYTIIDINSKPKKFFKEQTLVNFEKIWFFHDHIKKDHHIVDVDYLSNFEKKYNINLWKSVLNERFFYKHNRFYQFKKEEMLSILEQEIKLFESMLDEIKPDYFLTYDPVFHHQKLLLDLCKAKGIKIISVYYTGIKNKIVLATNGETLDLEKDSLKRLSEKPKPKKEKLTYDSVWKSYLKGKSPKFLNKFNALLSYLQEYEPEQMNSNFMYYGKSKSKVIFDALKMEYCRWTNFRFLQKKSILSPDLEKSYVYFPMNINEEMNILHYAPFYTDQIEVIRHVAKSIPIDFMLYVKEHPGAGLRGWNKISYYKEIMDIPNVRLIHPFYESDILLKNSRLLVTTRGTTVYKAVKYEKPAITFGAQAFEVIPSIFRVDSLPELPNLIKRALNCIVNTKNYEKYEELLGDRSCEFNMFEYENRRDKAFFAGGILSNIEINEKDVKDFLSKNESMFSELSNVHLRILS